MLGSINQHHLAATVTAADLSRQACRLADSVTQLVVTYKDLIGATRVVAMITGDQLATQGFLAALACRVVQETGMRGNWSIQPDHGFAETDPTLAALRLICYSGNNDPDMVAALASVTWQRGHMTVGLVTRALIQAWEEAHEVREMLR